MRRLAGLALALALVAPSIAAAAPTGFQAAWRRTIDDYQAAYAREGGKGSSVYFLDRGKVLAAAHLGYADAAAGVPVDAETVYHWASITKTFTAIGLMQLRDRGLLSLDDPVTKYIPELRKVHDPFGSMDTITLRQLVSHTAGFRRDSWPWGGDQPWHPHEPADWCQIEAMYPYTEILFEPGSRYAYSNLGMSLVGRVIEVVTGETIQSYLTKNVLMPLGMTSSYFDLTPPYLRAHRAHNYEVTDGLSHDRGAEVLTGATVANGGLNAPVPDMVKYLLFLEGLNDNGHYGDVLARASMEEMWRPLKPAEPLDDKEIVKEVGLGFFIYTDTPKDGSRPARYISHSGYQMGFRSFFFFDPKTGAAVIMAANSANEGAANDSARLLRNQLFDQVFPLFDTGAARPAR